MGYTEITAIKGVRNDVTAERMKPGELVYARNVDIDESGKASRRRGTAEVYAGAAHSLWSDGTHGFFVQGGSLKRFTPGVAATALCTVAGTRVCYEAINGDVYWSDGITSGIVSAGVNRSWGLTPPAALNPQPGSGALAAGTYLCTMTFTDRAGRESGAPRASAVTVGSGGAIVLTDLPVSSDPRVASKNIYVSAVNGDLPMLTAVVSNATTSTTISALAAQSVPVRTVLLGPPPAGQVIAQYSGRAYVAAGPFLFYSQPYEYELFDLRSGFIPFESDIQVVAPVGDGIFVGTTERTTFLAGKDSVEFTNTPVAPYGAIRGTRQTVDDRAFPPADDDSEAGSPSGDLALWMSTRGLLLGTDGGRIRSLTAKHYTLPAVTAGASLFKWRNGTPQYLVSLS